MKLVIFKPGVWNDARYTKEFSQELATRYNASERSAAVVIGHRFFGSDDASELAHGWVHALEVDDAGVVHADVLNISEEARAWVKAGKLKHASIEFSYKQGEEGARTEPNLTAVALLGRTQPAVEGAKVISLSAEETARGINKMCIACTELLGVEEEKHMPEKEKNAGAAEAELARLREALAEKDAQLAALEQETNTQELKAQLAEKTQALTKLEALEHERISLEFAQALCSAGTLVPAQRERVAKLHAQLRGAAQDEFEALLRSLPKQVELGKAHSAEGASTADVAPSTRVRAYQKKHGLASYADALEVLAVEEPELYKAAMAEN